MRRRREKTTIIIVNEKKNAIQPIEVPSKFVTNWKRYLLAAVLVFCSMVTAIIYLTFSRNELYESGRVLASQLEEVQSEMDQLAQDTVKEEEPDRFAEIDDKLTTINRFLKARGLKPAFSDEKVKVLSEDQINNYYKEYLNKVIFNLAHTPIGFPYSGRITSTFGQRENPFGFGNAERHKGVDIKGNTGDPVKATAQGRVTFAGYRGGYGKCIVLKHANGFETLYGHLSRINVEEGDRIKIGQLIGRIGSTGRSTGPHLHYEVHRNGKFVNPKGFLSLN
ncbi:peptidoglycan DD-metalloendopeptidase family protein [Pedobacter sp. SYP-B3415]|uniref:peptidoglycan DD-metalloendopeptidase family protein n=1 Tax=Pedobacter sp. SYP-B3415 TaxID=2496641 RepID=UPI0013ECFDEA|nr:peptidoglycan DD-metalloendopeptidase family protein [Pedobacter sp. SYP-B3415]